MCGISSPLAHTLVATIIFKTYFLKSLMVNSLSVASIAPWSKRDGWPYFNSSLNNSSASVYLSTNISTEPLSCQAPRISNSLLSFVVSSLTSIIWVIFLQAYPLDPTITSIGLINAVLAKFSTFLGKVALNITVCLSGLQFYKILVN